MNTEILDDLSAVKLKQNIAAFVILLVSLGLVCLIIPSINYKPHGLVYSLPHHQKNKPNKLDNIDLYQSRPYGAEIIGHLSIEMHKNNVNQDTFQQAMLEHSRELAARIGGNGVVIKGFGAQENIAIMEADVID